jgi:hypothetical protein
MPTSSGRAPRAAPRERLLHEELVLGEAVTPVEASRARVAREHADAQPRNAAGACVRLRRPQQPPSDPEAPPAVADHQVREQRPRSRIVVGLVDGEPAQHAGEADDLAAVLGHEERSAKAPAATEQPPQVGVRHRLATRHRRVDPALELLELHDAATHRRAIASAGVAPDARPAARYPGTRSSRHTKCCASRPSIHAGTA